MQLLINSAHAQTMCTEQFFIGPGDEANSTIKLGFNNISITVYFKKSELKTNKQLIRSPTAIQASSCLLTTTTIKKNNSQISSFVGDCDVVAPINTDRNDHRKKRSNCGE